MKERIRTNVKIIILFGILSVASLFSLFLVDWKDKRWLKTIITIVVITSIFVIAYSILAIIMKNKRNSCLEMLPYFFNYSLEYEIYKRIGHTKIKKWKRKHGSTGRQIPQKYTEWRNELETRYNNLVKNEDFYRFLKRISRNKEIVYDAILSISIPIEIAALTGMASFARTQIELAVYLVVSLVYIVVIAIKGMWESKDEKNFVDDVMEIFHPNLMR